MFSSVNISISITKVLLRVPSENLPKNSGKFFLISHCVFIGRFYLLKHWKSDSLLLVQLAVSIYGSLFVQITSSFAILVGGSLKICGCLTLIVGQHGLQVACFLASWNKPNEKMWSFLRRRKRKKFTNPWNRMRKKTSIESIFGDEHSCEQVD